VEKLEDDFYVYGKMDEERFAELRRIRSA